MMSIRLWLARRDLAYIVSREADKTRPACARLRQIRKAQRKQKQPTAALVFWTCYAAAWLLFGLYVFT